MVADILNSCVCFFLNVCMPVFTPHAVQYLQRPEGVTDLCGTGVKDGCQ